MFYRVRMSLALKEQDSAGKDMLAEPLQQSLWGMPGRLPRGPKVHLNHEATSPAVYHR